MPMPLSPQGIKAQRGAGLSTLAQTLLGKPLDKTMQVSDWEARPLSAKQFRYACLDATVLILLYRNFEMALPNFESIVSSHTVSYSYSANKPRKGNRDRNGGNDDGPPPPPSSPPSRENLGDPSDGRSPDVNEGPNQGNAPTRTSLAPSAAPSSSKTVASGSIKSNQGMGIPARGGSPSAATWPSPTAQQPTLRDPGHHAPFSTFAAAFTAAGNSPLPSVPLTPTPPPLVESRLVSLGLLTAFTWLPPSSLLSGERSSDSI